MFYLSKERLKLYLLAVLMTASIVQVGILWSYQYYGFPISFLQGFFGIRMSMDTSSSKARENYFKPYQVSITNGEGYNFAEYYIVDERNSNYDRLWKNAQACLEYALREKKGERVDTEEWYDLVDRKEDKSDKKFSRLGLAAVFEFSGNIDINLVTWFLNISGTLAGDVGGIYKFAIAPEFDANYNSALYILEKDISSGTEYAYRFIIERGETKLISNLDLTAIYKSASVEGSMGSFSAAGSLGNLRVPNDQLIVIPQWQFRNFDYLMCRVPKTIRIEGIKTLTDRNKLGSKILGPDADTCDSTDITAGIKFQNADNTYNIYDNGLFTYEFKSLTPYGDRGFIDDAFVNALEFIHWRIDILTEPVDVYLSGVEILPDSYRFTFDYKVDGLPVLFNFEEEGKVPVNNAIIIQVDEKRVLKASWIFKEFEVFSGEKQYNVSFTDNQDRSHSAYRELADAVIEDLLIAYEVKKDSDNQELQPSWIIMDQNRDYYVVPLEKK